MAVGIQNTLVYRVNFLFRACFALIPLMATISLWRTIYASKTSDVAGYSLSEMISYYLVVTIVDALTAVYDDDWQIAADIRDGNISQFVVKPIDYLTYRLCLFGAGRLVYTAVAFVPAVLFIFVQREHFLWPPDFGTLALFMISISLTALLQFFISYTLALLAFWVLEISTFIFIVFAFEYIAGGAFVSAGYSPRRRWPRRCRSPPVSLPALFPGQHLPGPDHRPGRFTRGC